MNNQSRTSWGVLILSCLVLTFCLLGLYIDVYRFSFTGALFEFLWVPAILLIFIIPIFSFILWIRKKFSIRTLYLYSLIISVITILIILYKIETVGNSFIR